MTVVSKAAMLPLSSGSTDILLCRGVMEHIFPEERLVSLKEMHRVLNDDGIAYFLIPPWYNAHAGHRLKPFHLFPFPIARKLRYLFFGDKVEGTSFRDIRLFKITHRMMLKMLDDSGFDVLSTLDTHFRMHFLTRIPLVREIAVPATAFIVRKKK